METKRTKAIKRAVNLMRAENTLYDNRTGQLNADAIDDLCGLTVTPAELDAILGTAPTPAAPTSANAEVAAPAAPTAGNPAAAAPAAPMAPGAIDPSAAGSPAEAHRRLIESERTLFEKQAEVQRLSRVLKDARTKASEAIAAWQRSAGRPYTQEMLQRDFLASEAANRRAGLKPIGRGIVPQANWCEIDRVAAASAGGNARQGGGLAFRRNATTQRGMKAR
jgi:hypothetical protein